MNQLIIISNINKIYNKITKLFIPLALGIVIGTSLCLPEVATADNPASDAQKLNKHRNKKLSSDQFREIIQSAKKSQGLKDKNLNTNKIIKNKYQQVKKQKHTRLKIRHNNSEKSKNFGKKLKRNNNHLKSKANIKMDNESNSNGVRNNRIQNQNRKIRVKKSGNFKKTRLTQVNNSNDDNIEDDILIQMYATAEEDEEYLTQKRENLELLKDNLTRYGCTDREADQCIKAMGEFKKPIGIRSVSDFYQDRNFVEGLIQKYEPEVLVRRSEAKVRLQNNYNIDLSEDDVSGYRFYHRYNEIKGELTDKIVKSILNNEPLEDRIQYYEEIQELNIERYGVPWGITNISQPYFSGR